MIHPTNSVIVRLHYGKEVLINVKDLPKLMEILDGAHMVDYNYVGSEQCHYVKDEAYQLIFRNVEESGYVTEAEYNEARMAAEQGEAA